MSDRPIVLGIDPGIAATGVALIQGGRCYAPPQGMEVRPYIIRTSPRDGTDAERIATILEQLPDVVPDIVAVETQHGAWGSTEAEVRSKAASAARIAALRGAVGLWAQQGGAEVVEVSPQSAKKALTGSGRAKKPQMVRMVLSRLGVRVGSDAADACGIALFAEQEATASAAFVRATAHLRGGGEG